MGLQLKYIKYILEIIKLKGYNDFNGLKMCELGNQLIRKSALEYMKSNNMPLCKTGKEYFENIGFKHISIDLNGKDGALPIDLTKPIIDKHLIATFDILTNSGTTEHVKDQFECFKNLHNLCKEESLFIHLVPMEGYWPEHSLYHYKFRFFEKLADLCEYKVLDKREINGLVCVSMCKTKNSKFISKEQFNNSLLQYVSCTPGF